jgi:hypothetical protein
MYKRNLSQFENMVVQNLLVCVPYFLYKKMGFRRRLHNGSTAERGRRYPTTPAMAVSWLQFAQRHSPHQFYMLV